MLLNKQGAWGESCLFAACVIEAGIILSMISILQSLRESMTQSHVLLLVSSFSLLEKWPPGKSCDDPDPTHSRDECV